MDSKRRKIYSVSIPEPLDKLIEDATTGTTIINAAVHFVDFNLRYTYKIIKLVYFITFKFYNLVNQTF